MNRKIGAVLSIVCIIFEVLSTLILTPFLIKTLGQSEFGVYKMCLSIIAYVLLLDLGIGNSIIRFAAKYRFCGDKTSENKLAGVSLGFYLIIAILALIIGIIIIAIFPYIFSKGLSRTEIVLGQQLILITAITSAITLSTSGFYNIIIAHEKFIISKGINIIQIILKIIFSFLVLEMGSGSIGVCFVNLILTLVVRSFYVVYSIIFLKIRPTFKGIDNEFLKGILCYSILIAIQMIATQINQSLDQILIGGMVSQSSSILGVYAIGAQLNQYFMSIGFAVTGVLMPGIVKFVEKKPNKECLTEEMVRLSRIILFPLIIIYGGLVIFGKQFISIWTSEFYQNAYYVAIILITPQLLVAVLSPCLQTLWALNKQKELAWSKLIVVLINIFLTIMLIQWDPLIGASIGTFISVFVGDVMILFIIAKQKAGLKVLHYIENTFELPIILIFCSCLFVSKVFRLIFEINTWVRLIVACFSFLCVSLLSLYFLCFNLYEKKQFKNILHIVVKRFKNDKTSN